MVVFRLALVQKSLQCMHAMLLECLFQASAKLGLECSDAHNLAKSSVDMIMCYKLLLYLQGIALSANKDYKVLGAAYPWIARRLLTERSVELRDTLRTLLYSRGRFQVGSAYKTAGSSLRWASPAWPETGKAPAAV